MEVLERLKEALGQIQESFDDFGSAVEALEETI
jgi:hypothetical protein